MYSARFQNLVAAVGSFLSRLDENSVATLVAGLTDCSYFYPLMCPQRTHLYRGSRESIGELQ